MEELTDFLSAQMHGRCDDVRRFFPAQLDDVFAKVGFNHAHAFGFKDMVEVKLL
jgi:hypothetical protein